MSLINDALKRAAQKPRPREISTGIPLQPIDNPRPARAMPFWLIPIVVAAVLVLAVWSFWKWWQTGRQTNRVVAAAAPAPGLDLPSEAAAAPQPSLEIKINTNLVVRTPQPSPAPAQTRPLTLTPAKAAVTIPDPPVTTAAATGSASPATPAASVVSAPAQAAVATQPPTFPDLKLQGIYYRLSKPSVLINGETLYIGEEIQNTRVTRIERTEVTVEWNGQKKILKLR